MSKPQIDIISSSQIDQQKWNACVEQSTSPLIYAYTYYLDYMADNWSGIVINDYEAVMPVPWRKKLGIVYAYDVPFIQQLGAFSQTVYEDDFFLLALVNNFRYGDYNFNYANKALFIKSLTNFIIDLNNTYEDIKLKYKSNLISNLNKAARENLLYRKAEHEDAIELYKNIYAKRLSNIKDKDFNNLKRLCDLLALQGNVIVRKVTNAAGQVLAMALLLNDKRRLYNIANSVVPEGRQKEANHFLFNEIFKEFAGSNLVFDFEGSDISGVKSFYKNFGALEQRYYTLHFNKLPSLIRWLKD